VVKKESVDERLTRLNKYWDTVLSDSGIADEQTQTDETTPQDLIKLGLTPKEAKAWLKNEPNYPIRRFVTTKTIRRRRHSTTKRNVYIEWNAF
jgi:hypothetical protein